MQANIKESPEESRSNWSLPWEHRYWHYPFWGTCSTMWTVVLISPPLVKQSRDLVVVGYKHWDVSSQVTNLERTKPPKSRKAAVKPLEYTAVLGDGYIHWGPRTQDHTQVHRHETWDSQVYQLTFHHQPWGEKGVTIYPKWWKRKTYIKNYLPS